MAIDTVIGCVQLAVEEPSNVAVLETSVLDSVEGLRPGQELSGHL